MMKTNLLSTSLTLNIYLACLVTLSITGCCSNVFVLANDHYLDFKVGFVANLSDRWGRMAHDFVNIAIQDFYTDHSTYKTRLVPDARDSQSDVITSAAKVTDLIKKEGVVAIIGPETSQEAQFDISLGERYRVPIISFSASSPMLSNTYFIQATQDDSSQVEAISSIIQNFGWSEVSPVYVNNQFGGGIIPFLVDALQQANIRIPYRCVIPSSATDDDIKKELSDLKDRQTRVFVVHMDEVLAKRVFTLAHKDRMMGSEYVWIVTTCISNAFGTFGRDVVRSMQGVLGVKTYVPNTTTSNLAVQMFKARWSQNVSLDSSNLQMSMYGLWAYDATFLLAEAVEKVHRESDSASGKVEFGRQLIKKLANATVDGLSGKFKIVNRKLHTDTFEIINVVENGEKEIGFWTTSKRLVRNIVGGSNNTTPLGDIIWPGGSITKPRGWAIPTKEKPLKIGVPIKTGFTEFVQANENNSSPTGFCIEVFEAVRKNLNYDLPVRYIPSPGSYDDLIRGVHSKEYDAVVGDVTIIANRSAFVDFALPYMESDVLMVVPAVKDSKEGSRIWAFLHPLSWKLWVTSLCFFLLIAVVVWVVEYEINQEFREESWWGQIGLCLYYSFSTMVFSNKEVPKSNMVRLVMVFWIFTLLLITQSYTASLASLLTVEKLEPAYKDVNELVRTGKKVGYQNGTFVTQYLGRMGFKNSNMIPYETQEILHQLLSKGSEEGGIDAAFDEAPYVKLFLSGHCSKYMTVVPPVSRTDGFAFVFPIGSPLVSDISRAVLNITEGDIMADLSKKWLNSSDDCPSDSATKSGSALDLDSFEALFAITGGLCMATLFWKLCTFVYQRRRGRRRPVLLQIRGDDGGMSLKKRLTTKLNKKFRANYKSRRMPNTNSAAVCPETTLDTSTSTEPSSPGRMTTSPHSPR
ncbi:hypothetical protein V2J09_019821 [Rumex salicifolius]